MEERGHVPARSDVAHRHHLVAGRSRRVLELEVDAHEAGGERCVRCRPELLDVCRRGGVEHAETELCPRPGVVERAAVVDERPLRLPLLEPPGRVVVDAVHAEVRRDAVGNLERHAVRVRVVAEQVDEAWRHDEAAGVDRGGAGEGTGAYGSDRRSRDADVGHEVEARLGIDHAPAGEHDVVRLAGCRRGWQQTGGRGAPRDERSARGRCRDGARELRERRGAAGTEAAGEQEPAGDAGLGSACGLAPGGHRRTVPAAQRGIVNPASNASATPSSALSGNRRAARVVAVSSAGTRGRGTRALPCATRRIGAPLTPPW